MPQVVSLCLCDCSTACQLLFSDNFDGELPLLNGSLSKWDQAAPIDVIGRSTTAGALFDLLPGHGVYVDMAASGWAGDTKPPGIIATKANFQLNGNKKYFLRADLAGNQRQNLAGFVVRLELISPFGDTIYATKDITIDDWKQPFTTYELQVEGVDVLQARIRISMLDVPVGRSAVYGILLDNVNFWECPPNKTPDS